MADRPDETPRPARPLVRLSGHRGRGGALVAGGRSIRAWIILAVIALVYLGWTLTVYFLEPGLR